MRATILLATSLLFAAATAEAAPTVDVAQRSGVAGFPIGVFGAGFGATQGTSKLTVLGSDAAVTKWTDGVIEATVPAVAPAAGQLVVTTASGNASWPFVVYAIDPTFLSRPVDLVNLAYQKTFVVTGTYTDTSNAGPAPGFLGYCNGVCWANMTPPGAAAVDLGQTLNEDVYFEFLFDGNWYETNKNAPKAYTIDASSDTTDGKNGTWTSLVTVTNNDRNSRVHKVTLSGQRWMRLSVTATTGDATWALTEIRAFKKKTTVGTGLDFFGIMGDSITADDLSKTGDIGLYQVLRTLKNDGSQPVTYVMGLAAQATYLLSDAAATEQPGRSLARALELTPDIRYFGIAFGTNDAAFDSNLVSMRQNLTEGLTRLLAAGKVPIVARMPDTDTANGGFGSLPNKKTALQNIDELVAQYKLVPGPDFYTFFRQNYAFLRDGTHHTIEGMTAENRIWAEAIFRSGIYGTAVDTTRPAAPTNLRRAP